MQKRYFELVLTPEGCMFYLRSEHNLSEEESKEAYEAGNTFIKKYSTGQGESFTVVGRREH